MTATTLNINENILRLTGKVNLAQPLELGNDYTITVTGAITAATTIDLHDGSFDRIFKLEPRLVTAIDDKGETLKIKDKGSHAQKLRSRLYRIFEESPHGEFENFYAQVYRYINKHLDTITDQSWEEKE